VKVIVNARNFGHIRSPMHAVFESCGDAIITIVADLQDPPEMMADMIREWENGYSMVLAIKRSSEENPLMFYIRKRYYRMISQLSSVKTFENFTGYGLYGRRVIEIVRSYRDPYPYFRGMIAEIGLPHKLLYYDQGARSRGITKNNFYTLYDLGMLGVVSHSKVPLRLMVFAGFTGAALSFLAGFGYFVYKLLFWSRFSVGIAPLVIGIFFLTSIQLVFMGILGEYVGAIYTQVHQRPLVTELERINFEYGPTESAREAPLQERPDVAGGPGARSQEIVHGVPGLRQG
jgi:glycosyltransferase involved in cell wall biosynthesis